MRRRRGAPILTWQQAETAAASWMKSWGYRDAAVTRTGPDAGLDVVARKAVAQVKYHQARTGTPDLQRLHGARAKDTRKTMLFFSLGYTRDAIAYAERVDMALFVYTVEGRVNPVNATARKIVARRPRFTSPQLDMAAAAPAAVPEASSPMDKTDSLMQPATASGQSTITQPEDRPSSAWKPWFGRNWRWVIGVLLFGAAIGGLGDKSNFSGPWYSDLGTIVLAIVLMFVGVVLVGWHLLRQASAAPPADLPDGIPGRLRGEPDSRPPRRRGLPDEDFDL
jgi:hypothetical protein